MLCLVIKFHLMVSGTAEDKRNCPEECTCRLDHDHFKTLCYQGI